MRSAPDAARATIVLAAALVAVYFGFQGGGLTPGVQREIEFRCNAVEYGLIPYEVTHPGAQLSDPYCQPQHEAEAAGHEHQRSDPGLMADAPTWLTPLTSMFMHGGLLHLGASVVLLLLFGPPLERRIGPWRLAGLFVAAGLATDAALVALAPDLPIATIGATGAVAGVIGAAGRGALLPAVLLLLAIARLDAAQPAAGLGGDIAYVVPIAGLAVGLLLALHLRPRPTPETRAAERLG
jgi:membrane associated rhomboid family serine protease